MAQSLAMPYAGPADMGETKLHGVAPAAVSATGRFEGYASLFNRLDLGRDVIVPGAFRASLRRRQPSGVRMLFQHDPAMPIGIWERIYEDARGLFVRGQLALEAPKAREIYALMRAGAVDGLSIGFRAVTGARDRQTGVRRLTEIDLWEISIVTFPMMPEARIETVKAAPRTPIAGGAAAEAALPASVVARIEEAARLIRHGTEPRRSAAREPTRPAALPRGRR